MTDTGLSASAISTDRRAARLMATPAVALFEVTGKDGAALQRFYGGLFDWFYAEVDDPAAYLKNTEQLGGQTILASSETPEFGLTFAFLADPEGHVVGLSRGAAQ